jgi:Putative zinc-finger
MTTIPLNCDGFANALADYLERDDSPRFRAAVEAHAASCADCGALLADLQQLRVDASGLPTLTPSRDLWDGVAARIEAPVIELGRRAGVGGRSVQEKRRISAWMRPAAAAAALVLVTAGVTYFATREALLSETQIAAVDSSALDPRQMVTSANDSARRIDGGRRDLGTVTADRGPAAIDRAPRVVDRAPPSAPRPPLVQVANPLTTTIETVYGLEIERLRQIIDQRRGQLDTATVGVIERNLTIIDTAIRESRAALARDPASALLNEQLNNALEQKVELLRAAALLPVRS